MCEFPCNRERAREAVEAGETVILGAPNVLRGGSHDARLCRRSGQRRACTALASDYYYPAALHAAFQLSRNEVLPLPIAWTRSRRPGAGRRPGRPRGHRARPTR
ncbi:MAG: hypothetical protein U5L11_16960 [Arhodomonas sp.]|nr:hypothetical protein [Arhodomonas sp.]